MHFLLRCLWSHCFLSVEKGLDFDNFGLEAGLKQIELIDDGVVIIFFTVGLNHGEARFAMGEVHEWTMELKALTKY